MLESVNSEKAAKRENERDTGNSFHERVDQPEFGWSGGSLIPLAGKEPHDVGERLLTPLVSGFHGRVMQ
jgi:hypothetical protein